MKYTYWFMGIFSVLSVSAITLVGVAQLSAAPAAIPASSIYTKQVSLGESKVNVYRAIGQPNMSMLNGALGDETESYFDLGLTVFYHRNKVEVLKVEHLDVPKVFNPSPSKWHQATVAVSK